jgi:hypothetical protein
MKMEKYNQKAKQNWNIGFILENGNSIQIKEN